MTSKHNKRIRIDGVIFGSCMKLQLAENVAAYMENRELNRDFPPIECSQEVIENVCGNYLLIKNILSHLPWQDKLICKHVCTLWNSIIHTLKQEQLKPADFYINLSHQGIKKGIILKKSMEFYTEPMAVFTFGNTLSMGIYAGSCQSIVDGPCEPECEMDHVVLDFIYGKTTAPKDCMYSVNTTSISYLPLPTSSTHLNITRKPLTGATLFCCGLFIPQIPGVEFKIINVKSSDGIQQELNPEIKRLTEKYIIKGVVACLTDNYLLYADQENVESLEFLRTMQPDIPFAFGGCLVEDTVNTAQDIVGMVESVNKVRRFVSGNLMSICMFLVPKDEEQKYNFEIYSLVIESTEWTTPQIQQAIQEFSQRVPKYEYSVALKLSCVGRQKKHENEQNLFRKFFPRTPQAGCFGNGELGVNHPRRKPKNEASKRPQDDSAYEKVHSYSTVYFHICWGKILSKPECVA